MRVSSKNWTNKAFIGRCISNDTKEKIKPTVPDQLYFLAGS
jgi:hypothetical protein